MRVWLVHVVRSDILDAVSVICSSDSFLSSHNSSRFIFTIIHLDQIYCLSQLPIMKTSASTIVLLFAIVSAILTVLNALSEHNDGLAVGRNEESRALRERGAVRPNLRIPKEEHVTMHVEEGILVDDSSVRDGILFCFIPLCHE